NTVMVVWGVTVGVPPRMGIVPPFKRMLPAASRLTVMVLSRASPKTVRAWVFGENRAVTDGRIRSVSGSRVGRERPRQVVARTGRGRRVQRRRARFQSCRSIGYSSSRVRRLIGQGRCDAGQRVPAGACAVAW